MLSQHNIADKYIVLENIDGEGRTRDEAIQAAWLEGIHQAVGSYIDSKTELNNDQWSEVSNLDPDERYGYAWLEALRDALNS